MSIVLPSERYRERLGFVIHPLEVRVVGTERDQKSMVEHDAHLLASCSWYLAKVVKSPERVLNLHRHRGEEMAAEVLEAKIMVGSETMEQVTAGGAGADEVASLPRVDPAMSGQRGRVGRRARCCAGFRGISR